MDQYISDPTTVKVSAVQHLKLQRQTPPSIAGVSERREERRMIDIEHSALLAEFMWQKVDVGASLPTVREKGVPYTDQHKNSVVAASVSIFGKPEHSNRCRKRRVHALPEAS